MRQTLKLFHKNRKHIPESHIWYFKDIILTFLSLITQKETFLFLFSQAISPNYNKVPKKTIQYSDIVFNS